MRPVLKHRLDTAPRFFRLGVYCKLSGQEKEGEVVVVVVGRKKKSAMGQICQVFVPEESDWKHIFP